MTSRATIDTITGTNLVAREERHNGTAELRGTDPRTGTELDPAFHEATTDEVAGAAAAAEDAFRVLRTWDDARRAAMLRTIADRLDGAGEALVERADRETALGSSPRLTGELARTTNQLRAFARLVDDGWYAEAIIDRGGDGSPDVRRQLVGLGPVAVFGASNFPLAFGVAGGDTAAALAAGCPVVAKGHPSHPGTSELVARAILAALEEVGAPAGTFSLIQGASPEVGRAVVLAPEIRAVGFTGSHAGGRALADLAQTRPEPIPVYAEMGSVNPLFVLPAAAAARAGEIAEGFAGSMTLGVGQFCTKPGLAFVPEGEAEALRQAVVSALEGNSGGPMLNARVRGAFAEELERLAALPGVEPVLSGTPDDGPLACAPSLLAADLDTFLRTEELRDEHFGPVSVVVSCPHERLTEAASAVPGSLTATIHADDEDADLAGTLQEVLTDRAGRIVYNGFPTGVAVVPAMQHGGPYPATTSPGHTSVGMTSIRRFLRPVAFQDAPDELLPPALRDANPLGIPRLVDWEWTREAIARPG